MIERLCFSQISHDLLYITLTGSHRLFQLACKSRRWQLWQSQTSPPTHLMNKEVTITAMNEQGWWAELWTDDLNVFQLHRRSYFYWPTRYRKIWDSIYSAKGRPEEKSNIHLEAANRCETAANSWREGSIGAHLCCKQIKQQLRLPTD